MMRTSVLVTTLAILAACGGLVYLHSMRESAADEAARSSEPAPTAAAVTEAAPAAPQPAATTDAPAQTAPSPDTKTSNEPVGAPETIKRWIEDTESIDPRARAAAIAALADAPKAQAIPALKKVLAVGEPNVDRHIALHSLYSLALRDGDTNGQIRDVIRGAVYHGDDDGVTQTAQSLLDDIEAEFSEREQNKQ